MAPRVRTQVAEGREPWLRTAAFLLATGCGHEPAAPPPATPALVDLATIPADRLPARVLEECHAPLRGTMNRVAATITTPDGTEIRAYAQLPGRLRTAATDGQYLLRDGACFRIDDPAGAATAAASDRLLALQELLDAAAFGPLHRATACTAGPVAGSYALTLPEAMPARVELRPQTLLPAAFVLGSVRVEVLDYLRTPSTWIAQRLRHPALGECRVRFDVSDVTFPDNVFAPPGAARDGVPANRIRMEVEAVERRSATPILVEARPVRWVVLDDPGDWAARAATYAPWDASLLAQDQVVAGFPLLTELDGRPAFAIPFRPRPGKDAARLPPGTRERVFGKGLELVVFPPAGDPAARAADGERMLRAVAAAQDLVPDGAVRCQVYVHLEDGPPSAAQLANPTVRMSLRVSRR